jgi:hypothetical protein
MDKNDFLELVQKHPDFIRDTGTMEVLDKTVRKIFLNFTVLHKKVIDTRINSPIDELFGTNVPTGAGVSWITELLDYQDYIRETTVSLEALRWNYQPKIKTTLTA